MLRLCIIAAAGVLCQPPAAGAIYKCHEGARVSYGDRPCTGAGAAFPVRAAPSPDPDTQARLERARDALREREKLRAAHALREERDAARAERAALAVHKRCAKLRLQRRWSEEDLARSRGDAQPAARLKLRRQVEALALECPA